MYAYLENQPAMCTPHVTYYIINECSIRAFFQSSARD